MHRERVTAVSALLCAVVLTVAAPVMAHVMVFGAKSYQAAAGKPQESVDTFDVSSPCDRDPRAIYTLAVVNGDAAGNGRVSSASVSVNGKEIVSSNDFNQQVASIERRVTLQPSNTLAVKITGGPRAGFVTLSISRHIDLTATVFAAKRYTPVSNGQTFHDAFAATSLASTFTLRVRNGAADGTLKVDGGSVSVNGNEVVSKQELKAAALVEKVVALSASNDVAVTATPGVAGSYLTVEIFRHVVDSDGPSIVLSGLADQQVVGVTPLEVRGTITDDSGVASFTINGSTPVVAADGSFAIAIPLVPGSNRLLLDAADCEGNATHRELTLLLSQKPPVITITSPADGAALNTTAVTVSGTAVADAGVALLTVNGQPVPVVGGAWSTTVTLAEGPRTLVVSATDTTGKQTTLSIALLIDLTAPVITASAAPGANAAGWNNSNVTVTFVCADEASGVAVCPAPVVLSADTPAEGQVVTGTATDKAGNRATASITLKLDKSAPQLEMRPAVDTTVYNNPTTILAAADDLSGLAAVSCNGVAATAANGVFTCSVPVTLGANAVTITATDVAGNSSSTSRSLTYAPDDKPPVIKAETTSLLVDGWSRGPVTVTFQCFDAETSIASCSEPATLSAEGVGQVVSGTAVDASGNRASTSFNVSIDNTAPTIAIGNAPQVPVTSESYALHGTFSDPLSGIQSVTCNGAAATTAGGVFDCNVLLNGASTPVEIAAVDRVGNRSSMAIAIARDTKAPQIAIQSPLVDAVTNAASVAVSGTVEDDDAVASVAVNGVAAAFDGERFTASTALVAGANTITVSATDRAGNNSSATVAISRFAIPSIAISAPADLSIVGTTTTHVTGSIDDPASAVTVNGIPATVAGNAWTADVPLAQGRTVITAKAVSATGHIATASVNIYRDSIPPRVVVYDPPAGATLFSDRVTLSGMVDDIVVGTVNAAQVQLTVNGIAATVANRAFVAPNVPLVRGVNNLRLVATDQAGNVSEATHTITYDDGQVPKLSLVSGNLQSAVIGSLLPQPLTVKLTDATGAPIAGRNVEFRVVANDGSLTSSVASGRVIAVATDLQGTATVQWTLGSRAGVGNNRVEAHAEGFRGAVDFVASATNGGPRQVVVDLGNSQFGVVGQRVPRPIVAVVLDSGRNRIAGVPVTFTAEQGGGSFDGQPSVTVISDSDGRAAAQPLLGPEAGEDNNVFSATAAGVEFTAAFTASGRIAGDPAKTRIVGVVLDNTNAAVPGASLRIDGTSIVTQSDAQGQFVLANVPVGYVKLFVDGSTVTRSGSWPMLEFPLYTIAGQDNEIGMPVYLLPIDIRRGITVDDTHGGTLTLPELPGFSLTVAAGSVTFPGGGRTGTVSVTLVHADKMPMLPSAGQQPRFIVTIQPPGAHFDPPAAISFPNVDGLHPGQIAEMFSFDHDLGQFVGIGTGSVTEDGSTIVSDKGVGIIKGGWHGVSNPPTTGTVAKCKECSIAATNVCVADPAKAGKPCTDDGDACTEDICQGGNCVHNPIEVAIGGISAPYRNEMVDRDDPSRYYPANKIPLSGAVYSNEKIGDTVVWRAFVKNVSMRTRVKKYVWKAVGPATYTGPASSEWFVLNLDWKPGTYTISCEITFDTGCVKTATMQQKIGQRTNDYIIYGVITQVLPEPTYGVSTITKLQFGCPGIDAQLLAEQSQPGRWNDSTVGEFVKENWVDRRYANYRLINATYDDGFTPPTDLSHPWIEDPTGPFVYPKAFGVSALNGFRQAIHVQFKYLVEAGQIVGSPQPVGDVFARTGYTPAPCAPVIAGAGYGKPGAPGSFNQHLEKYPDGTGFTYLMQIRAGAEAQEGYQTLNRRELPYVYFRARFEVGDAKLKSHMTSGSGSDPSVPDGDHDFSCVPTFYGYERIWVGTEYGLIALSGFPAYMDLEKFLSISKKVGSPSYPP